MAASCFGGDDEHVVGHVGFDGDVCVVCVGVEFGVGLYSCVVAALLDEGCGPCAGLGEGDVASVGVRQSVEGEQGAGGDEAVLWLRCDECEGGAGGGPVPGKRGAVLIFRACWNFRTVLPTVCALFARPGGGLPHLFDGVI